MTTIPWTHYSIPSQFQLPLSTRVIPSTPQTRPTPTYLNSTLSSRGSSSHLMSTNSSLYQRQKQTPTKDSAPICRSAVSTIALYESSSSSSSIHPSVADEERRLRQAVIWVFHPCKIGRRRVVCVISFIHSRDHGATWYAWATSDRSVGRSVGFELKRIVPVIVNVTLEHRLRGE